MITRSSFVSRLLVPTFAVVACAPHEPPSKAEAAATAAPEEQPPPATPIDPVPEPVQLDRRAAPAASVAGTVRDLAGVALAGARVCAWNVDPHAVDPTPRCVETDANGAYDLTDLVAARHEVHASAPERQPGRPAGPLALQPGERRTGVDVRLAAGGVRVSGVVRNTRGGPLAGAWVTNFDHDPRPLGSAAAPRGLEVDAYAAALERLDGVVSEGRAEHVPAQALQLLAVTAVDGRRGVPKADTVSGGRVAGSGGGARCGPASASCTHATSAGSRSRSPTSAAGAMASWTCASTACIRSTVGVAAGKKRTSAMPSSYAPSVTRQCKCTYTPACRGDTDQRPWRSFTGHRMSRITAWARLSATLASSSRS